MTYGRLLSAASFAPPAVAMAARSHLMIGILRGILARAAPIYRVSVVRCAATRHRPSPAPNAISAHGLSPTHSRGSKYPGVMAARDVGWAEGGPPDCSGAGGAECRVTWMCVQVLFISGAIVSTQEGHDFCVCLSLERLVKCVLGSGLVAFDSSGLYDGCFQTFSSVLYPNFVSLSEPVFVAKFPRAPYPSSCLNYRSIYLFVYLFIHLTIDQAGWLFIDLSGSLASYLYS